MAYKALHNTLSSATSQLIQRSDYSNDYAGFKEYYDKLEELYWENRKIIGVTNSNNNLGLQSFHNYEFSCLAAPYNILVETDNDDCPNSQNPSYYYDTDTTYGEFFELKYSTSYKLWYVENISDLKQGSNIHFINIGIGKNNPAYNIDIDGDNMVNGIDGLGRGKVFVGNFSDDAVAFIDGNTITTKLKVVVHGDSDDWFLVGGSYTDSISSPESPTLC